MLVLTASTYNGAPSERHTAAFGENGGTIGRAEHNHMVLPDAERTVSRVHADIAFRNGGYVIVDHGSNPIAVNGQEVGSGREAPLMPGDTLQIGAYLLLVSAGLAVASKDLFADLFEDTGASAHRVANPSAWPVTSSPAPLPAPATGDPPILDHVVDAQIPAAGQAAPDALLAALLDGLDVPGLHIEPLTPALMRQIGVLLRESTRGTVELLAARAAVKRGVRAEATAIGPRENNPLKFSPSVEVALQHLLGPPARGFMPAPAAMRDAFDDLGAHQIGMLAGMRAALEGAIARFDPAQLEAALAPRSGLVNLIPTRRKARLWESFEALHAKLSSEAEGEFHRLFGEAFVRAYETHIEQLQRDDAPAP